jgi:hypothetical protein
VDGTIDINGIGRVAKTIAASMIIERAFRRRGAGVRWVGDEFIIILSRASHILGGINYG